METELARRDQRSCAGGDLAVLGVVDLVEEAQDGVVEGVRRLGHHAVRGARHDDEAGAGDQLRELLGVADGSERVLRTGDDQRRGL